jgi:hypothetical protein
VTDQTGSEVQDQRCQRAPSTAQSGGVVYGLGLIGALVWFWQHADSPEERAIGVLKALVWPAFLVYGALDALRRSELAAVSSGRTSAGPLQWPQAVLARELRRSAARA